MLTRMLGLRTKRYIVRKEVIIEDPKYLTDAEILTNISLEISDYMQRHKLLRWPNPIRVFFHPGDDNDIEQINSAMEVAIEDLSYSKNNYVLMKLNQYPIRYAVRKVDCAVAVGKVAWSVTAQQQVWPVQHANCWQRATVLHSYAR